jgi:hypothetical protein
MENIEEVTEKNGEKLNHEGFPKLYSSPYIIRAVKSRSTRWAGHNTCYRMRNT